MLAQRAVLSNGGIRLRSVCQLSNDKLFTVNQAKVLFAQAICVMIRVKLELLIGKKLKNVFHPLISPLLHYEQASFGFGCFIG